MKEEAMKKHPDHHELIRDYDGLVHPSQVFNHPSDVVNDPDLSLNEKRAILSAWASDACAVEAAPALRKGPAGRVVQFDDIMDALRTLDKEMPSKQPVRRQSVRTLRTVNRRGVGGNGNRGAPLH
jgi:hypothetical protein